MEPETRARLKQYINDHERTAPLDPETEALRDWLAVLTFLWESIGKRYDATIAEEKRFDAYVKMFGDVPLDVLEKAVTRSIANNGKYQTIPTPGAIWDEIKKVLEIRQGGDVFEAIQTRTVVGWDRCVIRFPAKAAE